MKAKPGSSPIGCPSLAAARLAGLQGPAWAVTPEVFDRLAFGDRAEGLLAVVAVPDTSLDHLRLPGDALVLVAEAKIGRAHV